jgi:hypothetical protein
MALAMALDQDLFYFNNRPRRQARVLSQPEDTA